MPVVMGPSILLADEPTGNLDSATGEEIMRLFDYTEGHTIILVTHERDITDHAHRTIHIRDGKMRREGASAGRMPFSEAPGSRRRLPAVQQAALAARRARHASSHSSVIAIVANAYIAERVLELGSQSFTVQKFPDVVTSRDQWLEMQKRKDINLRDLQAVRDGCDDCEEVGGMLTTRRDTKGYESATQENVVVMGVTENATRIGTMRKRPAPHQSDRGRPQQVDGDPDRGIRHRCHLRPPPGAR